jgi:8-oxo-dGTP diphosphatase
MRELMSPDRQTVVVGVLYNQTRDRVLLCKRPHHAHQGGYWELPGGKLRPGETPLLALTRELAEEISILVLDAHRLITINHDYPDRAVRLEAWVVDQWSGIPAAGEGQPLEWVLINDVINREMPAANGRITKLLVLPSLYLITPDRQSYDDGFIHLVHELLRSGLQFLQFRSKASAFHQHNQVVRQLIQLCEGYYCRLIYNGTPDQAMDLGAHGVHLNSASLMQTRRRPLPEDKWLVASCHDSRELSHAASIGADFCVLSPVHVSPSHPAGAGMGWKKFKSLAAEADLPVYALGGIKPGEMSEARDNGAFGIAMISGVWAAPDPAGVVRKLNQINRK